MPAKKKSRGRRYSKGAGKSVASAMRRKKHGTLRSGRSGKGGKVKSRKQAIAIGLSKARRAGVKLPRPPASAKARTKKSASYATRAASRGGRNQSFRPERRPISEKYLFEATSSSSR